MDNYRGIYFNNSKSLMFFEGGAHFKYIDLYKKLLELNNIKNNISLPEKSYNFNLSTLKSNFNEQIIDNTIKIIKKEKNPQKSVKKSRNKRINMHLNYSDSMDNNQFKEINLNISIKSKDNIKNNNILNTKINETTSIIYYPNKMSQKLHNNSINKNYHLMKRKKKNLSALNKDENNQINISIKNIQKNKSMNNQHNLNN